jgi:mono/diheme cytochrome c family protein
MHLMQLFPFFAQRKMRVSMLCSVLVILAMVVAACPGGEPAAPTATPVPVEPVEEPEPEEPEPAEPEPEEPEAVETEEPEEEPVATEEPEEEPTATPEPEEEPMETAEPEEEPDATPEPEEEEEPDATPEPEEEPAAIDPAHGQYIMTVVGCGCHFNSDEGALAGGNRFQGPFGVAFAANITPDEETGIGAWSEQAIADALRFGAHPDGSQLAPAMPYRRFSVLSDQEALSVAAYLLSQDPVSNEVPERELTVDLEPFTPEVAPPAEPPSDPAARGEQLVILANCTDCHTPYDDTGSPDPDRYLSGAHIPGDEIAANITPHDETGIGSWSEQEIADYLRSGIRPDGTLAGGVMSQRIDQRFSVLTEEDALAIAAYLKSVPAIDNDPYE